MLITINLIFINIKVNTLSFTYLEDEKVQKSEKITWVLLTPIFYRKK